MLLLQFACVPCLQDKCKQLLPSLSSPGAPNVVDLLHLAINHHRPAAAEALLAHLQRQKTQLEAQQRQLMQVQQQASANAGKRRNTRGKAQREQQQQRLQQEIQELHAHVQQVEEQLGSAQLLEQLLVTAVARKHAGVVGMLCTLPAAARLPDAAVMQLLHRAIVHKSPAPGLLDYLLQLPGGAEATPGSLTSHPEQQEQQQQRQPLLAGVAELSALLHAAVQRCHAGAVQLLARQPAAQSIDTATAAELAKTAVELRSVTILETLSSIPAVQELGGPEVEGLLATAVQLSSWSLVRQLCTLPGSAAISPAGMTSLLSAAVQQGSSLLVERLAATAAAQGVSSEKAAQLLEEAMAAHPGNDGTIQMLLDHLPSAAMIPAPALARLLNSAIRQTNSNHFLVGRLCQLGPAAAALASPIVLQLLHAALETSNTNTNALQALCHLPGAAQLTPDELYSLLSTALYYSKPNVHSIVHQLCSDLATVAAQLEAVQVAQLLQEAVRIGSGGSSSFLSIAVRALVQLQPAQHITTEQAVALLKLALRCVRTGEIMGWLLTLQSVQQMSKADLADIVRRAFVLDKMTAAGQLLRLPLAKELDANTIAVLLLALLEQIKGSSPVGDAKDALHLLCGLPNAQGIPAERCAELLQAVIKLPAKLASTGYMTVVWLPDVMKLPLASQLTPAAAESLLQSAVLRNPWAVKYLTQMHAAQVLDAAAVERLLALSISPAAYATPMGPGAVAPPSHSPPITWLAQLPACKDLAPAKLAGLLHSALQQGRSDALKCLSQIEGPAARIDRATLLMLLRTAVQRMTGKGVTYVCRLLSHSGLTRGEVDALLRLNEEMGHAFDQSLAALLHALVQ